MPFTSHRRHFIVFFQKKREERNAQNCAAQRVSGYTSGKKGVNFQNDIGFIPNHDVDIETYTNMEFQSKHGGKHINVHTDGKNIMTLLLLLYMFIFWEGPVFMVSQDAVNLGGTCANDRVDGRAYKPVLVRACE